MSRIGKNPITIPSGVTVELNNSVITVKGKLGQLSQEVTVVTVKVEDGQVLVERSSDDKVQRAKHGLYRALINNMIVSLKLTHDHDSSPSLSPIRSRINLKLFRSPNFPAIASVISAIVFVISG